VPGRELPDTDAIAIADRLTVADADSISYCVADAYGRTYGHAYRIAYSIGHGIADAYAIADAYVDVRVHHL
jgi:hypothetical protein